MNLLDHPRNKYIQYKEEEHEYWYFPSGDKRKTSEAIQFDGVTAWIDSFAPYFDKEKKAKSSSGNLYSEWYGMSVEDIVEAWEEKGRRAINRGNYVHKVIENVINDGSVDDELIVDDFFRVMDEHELEPLVSEFVVYNKEIKRATPIDIVAKNNQGQIVVVDCKTYIDGMQWKPYGGEMFNYPLNHLSNTKYTKTSLQLTIGQSWLTRFYDVECYDYGYILLFTDKFELIPALYLPNELNKMEFRDLRREVA